jgi:hypothetical protein
MRAKNSKNRPRVSVGRLHHSLDTGQVPSLEPVCHHVRIEYLVVGAWSWLGA